MSKIKLLLDVVNDIRSLADSLEAIANAMADGDNQPKMQAPQTKPDKPKVTHEMLRELAVKISRAGKREDVKQLIGKYGVKNITAIAVADLGAFYADLQKMEDE